jgi:mannose-6-phosphate isomerase-like protein (cupin superfamily)
MKRMIATAAVVAAGLLTQMAPAQTATVDKLTQGQMMEQAQLLEQQAAESGTASAKLKEYPNHFTMMALRKKSGAAEVHLEYADFFLVVRGKAMLVTGGAVVAPQTVSAGEIRGTAVSGGTQTPLEKGDVVHIPASVPHQLLLTGRGDFVYFVIKVREK